MIRIWREIIQIATKLGMNSVFLCCSPNCVGGISHGGLKWIFSSIIPSSQTNRMTRTEWNGWTNRHRNQYYIVVLFDIDSALVPPPWLLFVLYVFVRHWTWSYSRLKGETLFSGERFCHLENNQPFNWKWFPFSNCEFFLCDSSREINCVWSRISQRVK